MQVLQKMAVCLRYIKGYCNIDGGFILKYGNIEINSSFDAIFDENKEELIDIVNKCFGSWWKSRRNI